MEALRGLVDYAGLFPPAQLDLARAIDEYRTAGAGSHAWMLGRFIVPLAVLTANADMLLGTPLSAIVECGTDRPAWRERMANALANVAQLRSQNARIEILEVPLPAAFAQPDLALDALRALQDTLQRNGIAHLATYVELPRDAGWQNLLDRVLPELANLGLRAKLRCGGVTATAFPTVEEVVRFIATAGAARVPFKATAGLHHPIRHRDAATGFPMHGFLNLLAGAAFAMSADASTLHDVIAEEDPAAFSLTVDGLGWRGQIVDERALAQTRSDRFVSYGSCSFDEPVDDLIALGMLTK